MTSPVNFELVRTLASEFSDIDKNELAKILTAFKQYHQQHPEGSLNKTKQLVETILNQKTFVRSDQTSKYYKQIKLLLAKNLGADSEALITLFWVRRLIMYEASKKPKPGSSRA